MERILIFDAMNLYIRSFAVLNFSNEQGEHCGGTVGVLQSTKHMIEKFHPTKVVYCWEGKNAGKKRRKLLAEYKEGRKVKKSLNRAFQWQKPEDEWVAFRRQLLRVKEYLETMPIHQIEIPNQEADDVVAYLCNTVWPEVDKVIVSSDRDYFQLVDDKTNVFRPVKKELVTTDHLLQTEGVHPFNWILIKSVLGDASDSIPGIKKGIGKKTLLKLFPFLNEPVKYSIDYLLNFSKENLDNNKHYQSILDSEDKIRLNWEIMQLHFDDFSGEDRHIVNESLDQKLLLKPFQLRLLFMTDNAFKQIHQFDSWNRILVPLNSPQSHDRKQRAQRSA